MQSFCSPTLRMIYALQRRNSPGNWRYLAALDSTWLDPTTPAAPPPEADSLIQSAMQKRPDLVQRRLDLESERKFARAEELLTRPSIGLTGAAGYVPAADAAVPGTYGAVGVNVGSQSSTAGCSAPGDSRPESRAAAAEKGVQDLELQIQRDVRTAWLSARNAFEKLDLTHSC